MGFLSADKKTVLVTGYFDLLHSGHVRFLESRRFHRECGEEIIDRMSRSLLHRGPDSSGTWIDAEDGIALGHRRLAIIELANSKSEIIFEPLPEDDPVQRQPDINQAKTSLEWEPKVSLEDGLKETFGYFRRVFESGRG